jgi:benzoylformate decarboxylase
MGEAIVADVGLTLGRLAELSAAAGGPSDRALPEPRPVPAEPAEAGAGERLSGSAAVAALADAWPEEGIAVLESPSTTLAVRSRLRLSRPGSYYFGAGGGLGFGIAASIGVQIARSDRPVVAILGEGSAQYGITALWTAAAYKVPVTFLVLRNSEYMILKWFGMMEQVSGVPGMDLPGLDVAAVASGYGVPSRTVSGREELTSALRESIATQEGPRLVQVDVASGMWFE